jgi:hypothetical protein
MADASHKIFSVTLGVTYFFLFEYLCANFSLVGLSNFKLRIVKRSRRSYHGVSLTLTFLQMYVLNFRCSLLVSSYFIISSRRAFAMILNLSNDPFCWFYLVQRRPLISSTV